VVDLNENGSRETAIETMIKVLNAFFLPPFHGFLYNSFNHRLTPVAICFRRIRGLAQEIDDS